MVTKEEEIEILLEVSARMNNPNTWTINLFHRHGIQHCAVGHVENVIYELYGHKVLIGPIHNSLDRVARLLFPARNGITSVNDNDGRIAAKSVIDRRIRDLKDGLDG
jgi:hypothetical protein